MGEAMSREGLIPVGEAISSGSRTGAAAERLRHGRLGYCAIKRLFDIAFSLLIIVAFSWLFLLTAIAVKIDDPSGPVFFGQDRVGRDGKRFRMWKFRSMRADAEAKLAELQAKNEKDGPVFKMANDPRITRVGRVIRKMSIDELPQFFNVLLSQMSVVDPRPTTKNYSGCLCVVSMLCILPVPGVPGRVKPPARKSVQIHRENQRPCALLLCIKNRKTCKAARRGVRCSYEGIR